MSFSSLVDDMNAMLHTTEPPSTDEHCIYKVPSVIRKHNEDAYTPNFVSIGPFHHGQPHLQNMESHKLIYFNKFLQRTEACLNVLINNIGSILTDIKCRYSETIQFSDNDLVKLILIDSGFIIELFWRFSLDDCLKPWLDVGIRSDLLLLENQLPFFVIEQIYGFLLRSTYASDLNIKIPSFLELTVNYFRYFNNGINPSKKKNDVRHFTDLIRKIHLQPNEIPPNSDENEEIIHVPSATQLLEAGVRFVNAESECLLDLGFSGGVLKIPRLKVEDVTEILFRNMVALEQCHYPKESYITDYVVVLDFLINTGKDADILVRKKVLTNLLGDSDSVADLFNGLCKNVIPGTHFSILCKDLNAFCSNRWNERKASLRRDYGKTPWQTAASVAGILLLVLTLLQSVCSVWQVVLAY